MEKTQRELLLETWQAMYGVPGTEEKGMVGDVKIIIGHLSTLNGQVGRNTTWRKIIAGAGGTALLLIISVLLHLMGIY